MRDGLRLSRKPEGCLFSLPFLTYSGVQPGVCSGLFSVLLFSIRVSKESLACSSEIARGA